MPRTDPADGMSLWLNNGAICLASGDANQLGTLSPPAMKQSLQAVMDTLPTHDPGDGSPWLNGGVLMRGTLKTP
ncbi:hypothetical protein COMNV_00875 [Commensalibacter sp. Nvir]|nr:hypothetical protein COMNV_00875 [Commensalibacter sp. Nvir]